MESEPPAVAAVALTGVLAPCTDDRPIDVAELMTPM
jgi:hypothetical protein